MNNNGVTNTNQNQQPTLTPMEGVRIAPVSEPPLNSSQYQQNNIYQASNIAPQQGISATNVPNVQNNQQTPIIQSNIQQHATINQKMQSPQNPQIPPPIVNNGNEKQAPSPKKRGGGMIVFLILIIFVLGFYIYYSSKNYETTLKKIKFSCSPITGNSKKELNIDSTLVKDLYSKVVTNIREDLAQPQFNDEMKLYLAYRQILDRDKYESNCNLFSLTSMEPYTCEVSTNFVPKAFKEETLLHQINKLFGENTNITLQNIQLGTSCIVGYQYIQERGEFVEGICNQHIATSYNVTKKLIEATSIGSTIILTEEVKYHANEKLPLPEYLKSGIYKYTFKLDMNYNYIFVNKVYEEKY